MKSEFLEVKGIKSHFTRVGDKDQKLVVLHGWNSDRKWQPIESFRAVSEAIAEINNVEVIVVDLPGFGKSDHPSAEGWNTWDYADWLAELLKRLEIKECSFYGHSFGCRIIVRYLLKYSKNSPPNLGGNVRPIPKSFNTRGRTEEINSTKVEKTILSGAAGIKWPLTFREKISIFLSKKLTFAKSLVPRAIQKFIITRVFGARDWGAVPVELKSTLEKVLSEQDFREDLKKIRTQILLIWGENDTITPLKSGKIYAEYLPNARLEIIAEAKHGMHKTHLKEVIGFVRNFLCNLIIILNGMFFLP